MGELQNLPISCKKELSVLNNIDYYVFEKALKNKKGGLKVYAD